MTPPRLAEAFLRRLLPTTHRDERLGDYAELYAERARTAGRWAARSWYWRQLARTVVERLAVAVPRRPAGLLFRGVVSDLRWGGRALARQPTFTLVAVVTLGVGIGINATVFSWLNAVLITPLPGTFRSADLVQITVPTPQGVSTSLSYPDYVDLAARVPSLQLAARDDLAFGVGIDAAIERTWGELVSGTFFDVLGVAPAAGRLLTAADDRPGAPLVAVISHVFWQSRLAGAANVVGRSLSINGQPVTIAGVARPDFQGGAPGLRLDLWLPMSADSVLHPPGSRLTSRGSRWLSVIGRPAAGATHAAINAELATAAADFARDHAAWTGLRLAAVSLADSPTGGTSVLRPVVLVLSGMAAIVLLVACANVANLLLARGAGRQRDLAVRVSLGASRRRVLRQLLFEGLYLAAGGAAVTALLLVWTPQLLSVFAPPTELPVHVPVTVDALVVAFTGAVACAAVLLFALVPALQASRVAPVVALRGAAATSSARRGRLRAGLVVAQVSLSVAMLIAAGLLLRSVAASGQAAIGFAPERSALAHLDLGASGYDAARGRALLDRLREGLRRVPGVTDVSFARHVPLGFVGPSSVAVTVDGYTPAANERTTVGYNVVGADYVRTMGMRIIEGREFTDADRSDGTAVTYVNATMARRFWPGRPALGGRVRYGASAPWMTVIGVVADVRQRAVNEPAQPFIYLPMSQLHQSSVAVHARTTGDVLALAATLSATIRTITPGVAVHGVTTLDRYVTAATFAQRMAADLLSVFGVLALALAAIGVYGVLAFVVSQRRRELGVRIAIGASRRDVFRLIGASGVRVVGAGLVVGVVLAAGAGVALRSLLLGVSPIDPITYLTVAGLLAAVAAIACAIPARRAAAIDPIAALRQTTE